MDMSASNERIDFEEWPDLYRELHRIAELQMKRERNGDLLQTTAVLHEAFIRLAGKKQGQWEDRQRFLAAAAVTMRRVLIDNGRQRSAQKRGGPNKEQSPMLDCRLAVADQSFEVVEIHDALQKLAEFAAEDAKALELMIFGGLTGEETAKALGVSASTIDRRVRTAKAWLRRELSPEEDEE